MSLSIHPHKNLRPKTAAKPPRRPDHILLIEDDDSFSQAFALALEQHYGGEVMVAADSFEASNLMSQHAYDLVITDWRLPALNGFTALRKAEQSLSLDPMAPAEWFGRHKIPVIVITACDSKEVERERRLKGCFQFLGVVSKEQPMDGILEQVGILFANAPLEAAS
jgi:CheY-like chemotaxis protein